MTSLITSLLYGRTCRLGDVTASALTGARDDTASKGHFSRRANTDRVEKMEIGKEKKRGKKKEVGT